MDSLFAVHVDFCEMCFCLLIDIDTIKVYICDMHVYDSKEVMVHGKEEVGL